MISMRAALYVVSAILELLGLGIAVLGVRDDRKAALNLLGELATIEAQGAEDPLLLVGLGGAQVAAAWAMDLHRRMLQFFADQIGGNLARERLGVGLFALGALVGLTANLVNL